MEAGKTGSQWLAEREHRAQPPRRVLQPHHWPLTNFEDRQLDEVARFESAMRRDELRGPPTCFQVPPEFAS